MKKLICDQISRIFNFVKTWDYQELRYVLNEVKLLHPAFEVESVEFKTGALVTTLSVSFGEVQFDIFVRSREGINYFSFYKSVGPTIVEDRSYQIHDQGSLEMFRLDLMKMGHFIDRREI